MKPILALAVAAALTGCASLEKYAPATAAGFEAGGVLGALDGMSGAIYARCVTDDGSILRVVFDLATVNEATGVAETVAEWREIACKNAAILAPATTLPE